MGDKLRNYEAMFLLDAGNPDFNAASEPVRTVLGRNAAEVLAVKCWDERRLSYEIEGRRRGLYVLAYFKADPERIASLERDSLLDERILRMLVLKRDELKEEEINAQTPASSSRRSEERRGDEEGDHRDRRRRRHGGEGREGASDAAETPPDESAERSEGSQAPGGQDEGDTDEKS